MNIQIGIKNGIRNAKQAWCRDRLRTSRFANTKTNRWCFSSSAWSPKAGRRSGFTLVELLLYIALSAVILMISFSFLATLLESQVKNQTVLEVEQQGALVMRVITQSLRNAEAVDSPPLHASSDTLSLTVADSELSPTIFGSIDGVIWVKEGGNEAIPLTNSRVIVSDLNFKNLARTDTSGSVRIEFTLSHLNPEGAVIYDHSESFIATASLRRP